MKVDHHCLIPKLKRRLLHDSTDTRQVLSLHPVADDGGVDICNADLSAALA